MAAPQGMGHLELRVELSETLSRFRGTETMRLVFNTTLTVDVPPYDDALRKAFIDLIVQSARQVYGPAAMLARGKPTIKLTESSRDDGLVEINIFEEALPNG
jgi:hypothetical protein